LSLSLVPNSLIDAALLLLLVAVVGDAVGGAADVVANLGTALFGKALDKAGDLLGAVELLEAHEVGGETGNVGRSYKRFSMRLVSGVVEK
jgi:hypothetical protein